MSTGIDQSAVSVLQGKGRQADQSRDAERQEGSAAAPVCLHSMFFEPISVTFFIVIWKTADHLLAADSQEFFAAGQL